jgi:DNA-binding CsgD family transcriptional regulator
VLGATTGLLRILTRHARASWIELRALRGRAEQGVLQLPGSGGSSPLLGLLRTDRPVAALCVGWWTDDTAALVIGREREPAFHGPELELFRLTLPVLTLADTQAADLTDSLGARLSPREEEIFNYLQRGYSNRQIALVLGTSPLTVRNQLARLFRKVGVSTRAELVGLAASCIRSGTR